MGLFDFLKPKNNTKSNISPSMRQAMFNVELEYLSKQVANFHVVGRGGEAKKVVDEFIERYGLEAPGRIASEKEVAQVCYTASYQFLPDLVYKRWNEFQTLWTGGVPFPIYLAITVAGFLEKRLSASHLNDFKYFRGNFGAGVDYYVIQFPVPPTKSEGLSTDKLLEMMARGETPPMDSLPVLGPYYTAVLHRVQSDERSIYILGQSPGGGTTLRQITSDGANYNYGPGSETTVDAFLKLLSHRL